MMAYAAPDRFLEERNPPALPAGLIQRHPRARRPAPPPGPRTWNRARRWVADLFYA